MCGCNRGSNRRRRASGNVPNQNVGTSQILVQQSQQQQQNERNLQKQIMARNRPIIKR